MEDSTQNITPEYVGRSFRVIGDEMNEHYGNTQFKFRTPFRANDSLCTKLVRILSLCVQIVHAIWLEI